MGEEKMKAQEKPCANIRSGCDAGKGKQKCKHPQRGTNRSTAVCVHYKIMQESQRRVALNTAIAMNYLLQGNHTGF